MDEEDPTGEEEQEEQENIVHYGLAGLWDEYNSSTGTADRNTYSMAQLSGLDFMICKPLYSDYYNSIGDIKNYEPIKFGTDIEIEDTILPAGQYRLRYTIADMLDRTYNSEFVNLTWDGSKAVFELPVEEEEE